MGGSLWAAADHWRVVPGRLLSGPMGKEDGVARLVMGGADAGVDQWRGEREDKVFGVGL